MTGDVAPPRSAGGFSTGSRIAGYVLEERIGRGGTAEVFRARDERLGRRVALKILAPELAEDAHFRERFIRESRAAAAVDDPHIIPLFEAGEASGVLFIAMRLVRGGDVRSLVRREGPLAPDRGAEIVSQVASALDAAHAAGLVHRDVKPANMLLDARSGRPDHVYLSDFGLTKALLDSGGLTGSGVFLGTVDYAAPEQLQGQAVDGRADQYALGCAAFELLCGEPPFRREHAPAAVHAHISEPPPLLTPHRPELPGTVNDVFARVLAKSPADRYPTCQQFADALRSALGLPTHLRAARARRPDRRTSSGPLAERGSPAGAAAGGVGGPRTTVPEATMPTGPGGSGSDPGRERVSKLPLWIAWLSAFIAFVISPILPIPPYWKVGIAGSALVTAAFLLIFAWDKVKDFIKDNWRVLILAAAVGLLAGSVVGHYVWPHTKVVNSVKTVYRVAPRTPGIGALTVLISEEAMASVHHNVGRAVSIYAPGAVITDAGCEIPAGPGPFTNPREIRARYQALRKFIWLQHVNVHDVIWTPDNRNATQATALSESIGLIEPRNPSHDPQFIASGDKWAFKKMNGTWLVTSFTYNNCIPADGGG